MKDILSGHAIRWRYGNLPVPIKKGYRFKGWYTAKKNGKKIEKSTICRKNSTLYAQWEKKSNTVKRTGQGSSGADKVIDVTAKINAKHTCKG